jgi:hypothetical protein
MVGKPVAIHNIPRTSVVDPDRVGSETFSRIWMWIRIRKKLFGIRFRKKKNYSDKLEKFDNISSKMLNFKIEILFFKVPLKAYIFS